MVIGPLVVELILSVTKGWLFSVHPGANIQPYTSLVWKKADVLKINGEDWYHCIFKWINYKLWMVEWNKKITMKWSLHFNRFHAWLYIGNPCTGNTHPKQISQAEQWTLSLQSYVIIMNAHAPCIKICCHRGKSWTENLWLTQGAFLVKSRAAELYRPYQFSVKSWLNSIVLGTKTQVRGPLKPGFI